MKYRILVKALDNKIIEQYWELNADQVAKFVDSNDTAYAIQHLEDGKPLHHLTTKKFWDNKEEFVKRTEIITLSNLAKEDKDNEISKLLLELS
jgi:hypothetical protein